MTKSITAKLIKYKKVNATIETRLTTSRINKAQIYETIRQNIKKSQSNVLTKLVIFQIYLNQTYFIKQF